MMNDKLITRLSGKNYLKSGPEQSTQVLPCNWPMRLKLCGMMLQFRYYGVYFLVDRKRSNFWFLIIYLFQETFSRRNQLQVPDCGQYFMKHLRRLSDANYVPTKVQNMNYETYCLLILLED